MTHKMCAIEVPHFGHPFHEESHAFAPSYICPGVPQPHTYAESQPVQIEEPKFTVSEIEVAVREAYRSDGHSDSWNLRVIYLDSLLESMKGFLESPWPRS